MSNNKNKLPAFAAAALASLGLSVTDTHAAAIAATGWDVDFVLGSGETYAGHAKPVNANIWWSDGSTVTPSGTRFGIPAGGAVTASGVDFQLQPFTGGTNNVVRGSGTLTLTTPAKLPELVLLGSTSGSGGSPTITLNFSDGPSSSALAFPAGDFPNWAGTGIVNPGLTSNGTSPSGSGAGFGGGLSTATFDLSSFAGNTLTSIVFAGSGNSAIFAVSGTVVPEPSAMALLGLAGLALLQRRRK